MMNWRRVTIVVVALVIPYLSVPARSAAALPSLEEAIAISRAGDLEGGAAALQEIITHHNDRPGPTHRAAFRLLSVHHLALKNPAAASRGLQQLLSSPGYGESYLEEEYGLGITRDTLRLWYALTLEKKDIEAAGTLTRALKSSEEKGTLCYTDFARFLLGEISEDRFLALKRENSDWCTFSLAASPALARFYVALRAVTREERERAFPILREFLQQNEPNSLWEQSIARLLLDEPLFPLPEKTQSARRCGCNVRAADQCGVPVRQR